MECPLCGKPVTEGDQFCGSCGYNLGADEPGQVVDPTPEEAKQIEPVLVVEPTAETAQAFELPIADEAAEPKKVNRNGRTLIIVGIILIFVLCCCCIGGTVIINMLSQPGYSYSY